MRTLPTAIFAILFFINTSYSQKKEISLEDIWLKGTFRSESFGGIKWMKNDNFYSAYEGGSILKYSVSTNSSEVLLSTTDLSGSSVEGTPEFDDYEFSEDEKRILFTNETEPIYRRSFKANYFLYDTFLKGLIHVPETKEKVSYMTFSPDGSKLAYVTRNNLFFYDISLAKSTQVTFDGEVNRTINGSTDWVYEEEFEFAKAFFWSPDSKKIAFYTFDESQVKEYNMQIWSGLYPIDYKYKYPKAGEKNSEISIKCYDLEKKKILTLNTGPEKNNYIPRIKWTSNPDILSILRLSRKQNHMEILHVTISSEKVEMVYEEKNDSYIEINDDLTYLKDGKYFLLTSERDGFRHIYAYEMNGKPAGQITKGAWEVDRFAGVDEKKKLIFYTSSEESPLERYLYQVAFTGKNKRKLTQEKGTHEVEMSPGCQYFIDQYSTANQPLKANLFLTSGKFLRTLIGNEKLISNLDKYQIAPMDFFQFKNDSDVLLNASIIKPLNFDPQKKYPVMIFTYGGPGSQNVRNSWGGANFMWFQVLAQKGYIVVSIDNRGTGGRGAAFKKITQNKLGKYELEDLISGAKYLSALSYIDKSRIGIFGWSYGGYMSSLAVTLGADFFKMGIAVAPVITWRFYDTIYTERFLGLPSENAAGYDDYSPLSHASKLKGKYLLIHGTADDNVHVQNSFTMQEALIQANKQFDVFYYPDKNHGIYGGNTRFHLYKMMTDYVEKSL